MPINKEMIQTELDRIRYFLKKIDHMQMSKADYLRNEDLQHLLAFRIQQAIEKCIDVATHIVANEAYETIENARTAFEVLGKHQVLSPDLAQRIGKAVGMRNIIVHEYDEINYDLLFETYTHHKSDIEAFVGEAIRYLEKVN